jgi:hypothetical protein
MAFLHLLGAVLRGQSRASGFRLGIANHTCISTNCLDSEEFSDPPDVAQDPSGSHLEAILSEIQDHESAPGPTAVSEQSTSNAIDHSASKLPEESYVLQVSKEDRSHSLGQDGAALVATGVGAAALSEHERKQRKKEEKARRRRSPSSPSSPSIEGVF